MLKTAEAIISSRRRDLSELHITAIGRKAIEHMRRRHRAELREAIEIGTGWIEYDWAAAIARRLADRYADGEVDEVVTEVAEDQAAAP